MATYLELKKWTQFPSTNKIYSDHFSLHNIPNVLHSYYQVIPENSIQETRLHYFLSLTAQSTEDCCSYHQFLTLLIVNFMLFTINDALSVMQTTGQLWPGITTSLK